MPELLLTGFAPFGDHAVNPSGQIADRLDGEAIGGYRVRAHVLPVVYEEAGHTLIRLIETRHPDAVVALGLAAGRQAITPERIAINCMDGPPDNAGNCPQDAPIVPGGPAAYFSTLPLRRIVEHLRAHGIPAEISNTAGTYVCNSVMYRLLHHLAQSGTMIPAGFIHIPCSHELAVARSGKLPSWPIESLTQGIRLAIEALGSTGAITGATVENSTEKGVPARPE